MRARLDVLLFEDDARDAERIEAHLALFSLSTQSAHPGFVHRTTRVDTREGFERALVDGNPDLILSDFSLPACDGMSALRLAHAARPDVPFIFVSDAFGEEIAIESFKCGASDYVLKEQLERLPSSVARALQESAERIERRLEQEQTAQQLAEALERARRFEERALLWESRGRLYEEAQKALKRRNDVLAVVSHDLRNPLSNVMMIAHMLSDVAPVDELSERVLKQASMLDRSARRMERIICDLMDLSSIESGHLGVEPQRVSQKALLDEVGESMEPLASEKGIDLLIESSDEDREFDCDRGRLIQVFCNLIGHAVQYTPQGGAVTVRTVDVVASAAAFEVRDAGPGFPAEQLARIFEPYWQGKSTPGGLGLAISKGIVDAHGGRIWVESTVGQGTAFCFALPLSGTQLHQGNQ